MPLRPLPTNKAIFDPVLTDEQARRYLGLLIRNSRACGWILTNVSAWPVVIGDQSAPMGVARAIRSGDLVCLGDRLFRFELRHGSVH